MALFHIVFLSSFLYSFVASLLPTFFRPSFSPLFRSNSLLCFDTIRPYVTTIEPLNEILCHLAVEVFTKIRRYVSVLIEIEQPMISLHEDKRFYGHVAK